MFNPERKPLGNFERTALLAMTMALAALAIDMLLPAFPEARAGLGLEPGDPEIARTLTVFFLGLALGQVFYGPFTDRYGRKPVLYVGFAIYAFGAVASALSPTLEWLLVSRFIWGLGASGARVVSQSIIRDRYEGEEMARAMSFIMAVFIIVPMIAPFLGSAVLQVADWRWVFWTALIILGFITLWSLRMPESLAEEDRRELSFARVAESGRVIVGSRQAVGYTLAMAGLFGVFASYLGSSKIIVDEVFELPGSFPVIFGSAALIMGASSLLNAKLVMRFGLERHARTMVTGFLLATLLIASVALLTDGTPTPWQYFPAHALVMWFYAPLIPNLTSLAMKPMGHLAGTATAVIGTFSMAVGAVIGSQIDAAYNGTLIPLALAFFVGGLWSLGMVVWVQRGDVAPAPESAGVVASA